MPRSTVYPQWVRDQVPPGHTVKKNGNQYYLYKTKSVYVPGKKNPQPQSKYVGVITENGIRYSSRRKVDTESYPEWYEYGFSRCFYNLCFSVLIKEFRNQEITEAVVMNVIKQLSPHSYLLKDREVPSAEEMKICICNQIRKIEEKKGILFKDYEALKDIHMIEIEGRRIITAVHDDQRKMAEKLGVNIYD